MTTVTTDQLFEMAQALAPEQRRELADRLVHTVDDDWAPTPEERKLIHQRLQEVQSGGVEPINEDQMWKRVANLRAKRRANEG